VSAALAAGLSVALLGGIVGGSVYASTIDPAPAIAVALVGLTLYPGLVGIIAARSRSSDVVIAIVTLVVGLAFASLVLIYLQTPWGWPARRVIVIGIAVTLVFTGLLFGVLLATARVARPGGLVRGVAALIVGIASVVVICGPIALYSMVVTLAHGRPGGA
jgi:hypothetical protein